MKWRPKSPGESQVEWATARAMATARLPAWGKGRIPWVGSGWPPRAGRAGSPRRRRGGGSGRQRGGRRRQNERAGWNSILGAGDLRPLLLQPGLCGPRPRGSGPGGRRLSAAARHAGRLEGLVRRAVRELARLVLAGVFIAASLPKLAQPLAFAQTVANYRLLPESAVTLTALALPWLELVAGGALLVGFLSDSAALLLALQGGFGPGAWAHHPLRLLRGGGRSAGLGERTPAGRGFCWRWHSTPGAAVRAVGLLTAGSRSSWRRPPKTTPGGINPVSLK